MTPYHDAQVGGGPAQVLSPLRLLTVATKSEDYTNAPQHLNKQCTAYGIGYREAESGQGVSPESVKIVILGTKILIRNVA